MERITAHYFTIKGRSLRISYYSEENTFRCDVNQSQKEALELSYFRWNFGANDSPCSFTSFYRECCYATSIIFTKNTMFDLIRRLERVYLQFEHYMIAIFNIFLGNIFQCNIFSAPPIFFRVYLCLCDHFSG